MLTLATQATDLVSDNCRPLVDDSRSLTTRTRVIETVTVVRTLDGAADRRPTQTITIIDDDAAATGVVLEVSPTEVGESAGATTLMVTGTLTRLGADAQDDRRVAVSVSAGTGDARRNRRRTRASLTVRPRWTGSTRARRATRRRGVQDADVSRTTLDEGERDGERSWRLRWTAWR